MLVVYLLVFVLSKCIVSEHDKINMQKDFVNIETMFNDVLTDANKDNDVVNCTGFVLSNYFNDKKTITLISMDFDGGIPKLINSFGKFNFINRNVTKKTILLNDMYLITVRTEKVFVEQFENLTKDATWNPKLKFLIVFKELKQENVKDVFDILLKHHVLNVVIANGTNDPNILSYNPYENYACGKYYTGIINYGKCINTSTELYPNKLVTGLRDCIFNVSLPHWPPYTVDPGKISKPSIPIGIEQYTINVLAEIEKFKVNYQYNYDADVFSTVDEDMKATGPMDMLQRNLTDLMIGGMLLVPLRAAAFSYIYTHVDYIDEISVVIQKASLKPVWSFYYREFDFRVWALLIVVFILFTVIVAYLLREQDKTYILLKLLDYFFLHGYKLRFRLSVRCIFIFWIWFTYLVNSFYQTSMMSFTTKPSLETQIADMETLVERGIEPCISRAIINFLPENEIKYNEKIQSCKTILGSIMTVSKSKYLYTIVMNTIYMYNKNKFVDEFGDPNVYSFSKPVAKVIYGIFTYKGFPLHYRFHRLALRIREAGLIWYHRDYQNYINGLVHRHRQKYFVSRFAIPWYVFTIGTFLALVAFVFELNEKSREIN
ncbi:uncharacterized protein LOC114251799 [Bombyx mandarina]|uniref:Uncharacterized protein LOC114251799 n=1 Tax=Bombyx mandarina TaxID=7092 RepID=A0A6J2KI20_BOMMA|nr:uncharacterized protein LOC114251799 [Bombyx mandarina]